jgi:hypothetical protein
VHDSAGAGHEVRRVEDAGVPQAFGIIRLGELVVGGTCDDAAMQPGDRVDGEGAAQGARGVDVTHGADDIGRVNDRSPGLGGNLSSPARVHVADQNAGAALGGQLGQIRAHIARTLHENGAAG